MPVRCAHCGYDLIGLPARNPCPECGSRKRRRYFPRDWTRLKRWPGLLAPIGGVVVLIALALTALRVLGWLPAIPIAIEGLLIAGLGLVRWE